MKVEQGLAQERADRFKALTMTKGFMPEGLRTEKIAKTDEQWRAQLTPEQYDVTRKHGTERAFAGPWLDEKRPGLYRCVCCGAGLFDAVAKFDSGTGWPSFYEPLSRSAVDEHSDRSLFMRRTEVRCARCDAHLGHVFPDGPRPSGLRYCMNGQALAFKPTDS